MNLCVMENNALPKERGNSSFNGGYTNIYTQKTAHLFDKHILRSCVSTAQPDGIGTMCAHIVIKALSSVQEGTNSFSRSEIIA